MYWMCGIKNVTCSMAKLIRVTTVPLALRTLLAGQLKFMKQNGWEVIMISADGKERQAVIENEGCRHEIVPMTRAITPFKDIVSLIRLYRILRKEKPQIVHSHTPKAGLLAMIAGRMAKVPVCIHTIAGLRFMTTSGFKKKLLISMEKLTCRMAHHVWVNSFSLKEYIQQNRLCNNSKLEVIGNGSTNGIDLQRFNSAVLKSEVIQDIKDKIKYDSSLFYFLFVGRLVRDKGINELAEAFVKINAQYPSTRLLLVGALENELDPIDQHTQDVLLSHPAIIRTGWDNRIEYYFDLANVFVFPSYREGFPNVLLQAGAMGCPVICSSIPGNVDVVTDRVTGLLFPAADSKSLYEKMNEAYLETSQMGRYANNLKIKVGNEFSQIFVHRKIEAQYHLYLGNTTKFPILKIQQ